MIKVENIEVMNLPSALKGMRNPLESWHKSDSGYRSAGDSHMEYYAVGPKDLTLALQLVNAGSDHSKFMRQILVSMDVTAPDYWFKEFDTYKVGTVANSTSTVHKLGTRSLRLDDFSWDGNATTISEKVDELNGFISQYRHHKDRGEADDAQHWWRLIIQLLPMSYNYLRTITLNYAVLRNMYRSRKNHRLVEWRDFCNIIEELPYSELITT